MANHKSALKRIRANETKRLRNRYQHKSTRTMIKNLRATTDKTIVLDLFKKVSSALDKLAKKNKPTRLEKNQTEWSIIHFFLFSSD